MDDDACELTRGKAGSSERECNVVSANYTLGLSLNVGEIEGEGPKHAHVLSSLEVLKVETRICICGEPAYTGRREARRSVKPELSAIQLGGEAGVHVNADADRVKPYVSDGDRTNRSRDSQVVRAKIKGDGIRGRHWRHGQSGCYTKDWYYKFESCNSHGRWSPEMTKFIPSLVVQGRGHTADGLRNLR